MIYALYMHMQHKYQWSTLMQNPRRTSVQAIQPSAVCKSCTTVLLEAAVYLE